MLEVTQAMFREAAQAAHEANHIYNRAIGEHTSPNWADLPEKAIEDMAAAAQAAWEGATLGQSHERWCASKRDQGWTHGPIKDWAAKTHPDLVPFADLPPEQRRKDYLFLALTKAYLQARICEV